jgi:hypothetical protein
MFKKRKVFQLSEEDETNYLNILNNLFQILLVSNIQQSLVIKKLITLLNEKNYNEFNKLINSLEMWAGSGSVWEVYIENENDSSNFEKQMILLINLMEKTNYLGRGIKSIRKIFETNQNLK